MLKATQEIKEPRYRIHQNQGDVWLDCNPSEKTPLIKIIEWILSQRNLTIKNLWVEGEPPRNGRESEELEWFSGNARNLKVDNMYTNSYAHVYSWVAEGYLKKIIHLDERITLFPIIFSEDAEIIITDASIRSLIVERIKQFKFGVFGTQASEVTYETLMELKDALLQTSSDFREFHIKCLIPDEQFDELNISLETFNSRDSANPNWARFEYPNQKGKFLRLCVMDGVVWFKGPGYVPGELERAEEELRAGFKENEWRKFTRHQTIGLKERIEEENGDENE
uniref:FBA_2 domain-containing protein n=1 Tax=Caenorhabditis tropicalis TaxID=1561998 RepID=A0A1I7UYL3_9PELO